MAATTSFSKSITEASDEADDFYCEPCVNDGKQIGAKGYCVDCSEYLCRQCYKQHTRYSISKHHVLQDKNTMPQTALETGIDDACEELCSLHPKKTIEYFCRSCDKLGCNACINVNHRKCKHIDHIPDIVQGIETTEELKEVTHELDKRLKEVTKRKDKILSNKVVANEMEKNAKEELKKQRIEITKFFEQREAKMERKIVKINKSNKKSLDAALTTCETIHEDLIHMKATIETKLKNGKNSEVFICMKKYTEDILKVKKEIEKSAEKMAVKSYGITPSEEMMKLMDNKTEICRLRTAKLVAQVSVHTEDDKEQSKISGLDVVKDVFVAVADGDNHSIKLIDARNMTIACELILKGDFVWNITNANDDHIVVLVSSDVQDKIQVISVSADGLLNEENVIKFKGELQGGLEYRNGNLFVVCNNDVRIIDMQGRLQRIIQTKYSQGIAVSPDNTTIYLTNPTEHTVTSMAFDGKVKAIYKDKHMESPEDITVDSEGLVYVSCLGTSNVHQLTKECTKVQVLQEVYGQHISYSNKTNQLYVGLDDNVKVYQFE